MIPISTYIVATKLIMGRRVILEDFSKFKRVNKSNTMYPTQLQYGKDSNGNCYGNEKVSATMILGGDSIAVIYSGGGGTFFIRF